MRHQLAGRQLGRNASHRLAMFRNMTRSLIEHGRIITTEQKAKELRPFIEKIITLAKRGLATGDPIKALHARRIVMARLGPVAKVPFHDKDEMPTDDNVMKKLFGELAPRYKDRPGGYTRIIKRHERRLGDAGVTAFIELLKEGEVKVRASVKKEAAPAVAPAPVVAPEPAPAPAPETPPNS
ncbi:MAG: 50S ribosomal protein L17 [Planctomycetes bacterium]|nr:50S ribosomal protein L17 [Planctomycetota bacterium]